MKLLATLFLLLSSLPAFAQSAPTTREFDAWVMETRIDDDKELVCSMRTFWENGKREFSVDRYANSPRLALTFANSDWTLPEGTEARVRLVFQPTQAEFTATTQALIAGQFLTAYVTPEQAESWLDTFADASMATIFFPDVANLRWLVNTKGTREAVKAFRECSRMQTETSTNPFGAPARKPAQPGIVPTDPANPFRSL